MVTRDREPVEHEVQDQLGAHVAEHFLEVDEFGLSSTFFTIGNEFFEVVHAVVPGSAADRLIERRGGDTGFVVMLEVASLDSYEQRAQSLGMRVIDRIQSPEGRQLHFHPKDAGGIYLSVIEISAPGAGEDDGPWVYGGADWRASRRFDRTCGISAAEFACADALAAATRWADLLGLPLTGAGDGWSLGLRGGELRFVPAVAGAPTGFVGLDVRAVSERGTRHVGGLTIQLVPA